VLVLHSTYVLCWGPLLVCAVNLEPRLQIIPQTTTNCTQSSSDLACPAELKTSLNNPAYSNNADTSHSHKMSYTGVAILCLMR
jgi:hypothetical protein